MISYLRGKLIYKSNLLKKDNFVIIDVGGVGYKVFVQDRIISENPFGQEIELFVFTQVAETVLDLYGFKSQNELNFFELLNTISGIGPRSAMDILRKAKIEDLTKAVQTGNFELLCKVSSLGPKTAEKIVVGLKDKLGNVETVDADWNSEFGDALEALIALGYQPAQAKEALANCKSDDAGEKIRQALKILGK